MADMLWKRRLNKIVDLKWNQVFRSSVLQKTCFQNSIFSLFFHHKKEKAVNKTRKISGFSSYSSYWRVDQTYHPFITPSSRCFSRMCFFTAWFRENLSSESTDRMVSCPLKHHGIVMAIPSGYVNSLLLKMVSYSGFSHW